MTLVQRMSAAFAGGVSKSFEAMAGALAERLPSLLAALLVLLLAWLVARIVAGATQRVLARTSTQAHVDRLIGRTVRWTLLVIGFVTALGVAGVNVGALVTSLGLAGLTLGFALKDVLANSVAGVMLLVQRPFRIGDTIVVGSTEGVVADVRVRDTLLHMADGRYAYVPNLTIFNDIVVNLSQSPRRRFDFTLTVPAGLDLAALCGRVLKAVAATEGVLSEPAADATVAGVGAKHARMTVTGWVEVAEHGLASVRTNALHAAQRAVEDASAAA